MYRYPMDRVDPRFVVLLDTIHKGGCTASSVVPTVSSGMISGGSICRTSPSTLGVALGEKHWRDCGVTMNTTRKTTGRLVGGSKFEPPTNKKYETPLLYCFLD